jgi:hypothetical protein
MRRERAPPGGDQDHRPDHTREEEKRMTETINQGHENLWPLGVRNIAEAIRDYIGPSGERFDLHMQARRLSASLDVVSKWIEAADASGEEPGVLAPRAEYIRDQIEESLSRVSFEIDVYERRRVVERMAKERKEEPKLSEARMRGGILSDALIDAFVIVSDSNCPRRYAIMGALMVAGDLLPDEIEPGAEAPERGE